MKKLYSVMSVFGIIVICAIIIGMKMASVYKLKETEILPEQLNIIEGVYLQDIKYDNDTNFVEFTLRNDTINTIYFGEQILFEKNRDGKWYEFPPTYAIGFTAVMNYLPPSDKSTIGMSMDSWRSIANGEYRIVKEVSKNERFKDLYYVGGSFTVAK